MTTNVTRVKDGKKQSVQKRKTLATPNQRALLQPPGRIDEHREISSGTIVRRGNITTHTMS